MTAEPSSRTPQAPWFTEFDRDDTVSPIEGLVRVDTYDPRDRPIEEVATLEKARSYHAHSVFFEPSRNGRPPIPQAFVFVSNPLTTDSHFAELHRRLWSWGGVPLLYRKLPGQIQLFRCAHRPDFASPDGTSICRPFQTLDIGSKLANTDVWWDADHIRNGTLWDDPHACKSLLSPQKSAHRHLVDAVRLLHDELSAKRVLTKTLRRRLLILCLLVSYLEEREVLKPGFFSRFLNGATTFFHILRDGHSLVAMLRALEAKFNGNVFSLTHEEATNLQHTPRLKRFASLVEGHELPGGQLSLWRLYSFKDLPVELLSNIYQLFVTDSSTSIYTPPHLVRLILSETLPSERLDRFLASTDIILDPACGSGVFLVEAYKRLVLHWRSKNSWATPGPGDLRMLLKRLHGIDLEAAAVELAAFSLCLTLCDSLKSQQIRDSVSLFPRLIGTSLHQSCFFDAITPTLRNKRIGAVVGNPPFESHLTTSGARHSYQRYCSRWGRLPDKQLAYLFLHEAMEHLAADGLLGMIQPAGLLYNHHAALFRTNLFARWHVREVLDFVSVRGLFKKGKADPKVVAVIASATPPDHNTMLLHAVFRRSARAGADQGFDIDYYDLHWLPRTESYADTDLWRANLLGGSRLFHFLKRLRSYRTLEQYSDRRGWSMGEGYIAGRRGSFRGTNHVIGKPLLPTKGLSSSGLDPSSIRTVPRKPIAVPRSPRRFTPPLLLVKEHEDTYHAIWEEHYLTYKNEIVGITAPAQDVSGLRDLRQWLLDNDTALRAYVAGISSRLFTKRATSIGANDIKALPYPEGGSLNLSPNEEVIIHDVVRYLRDYVRLGSDAAISHCSARCALRPFADLFAAQINVVYPDNPLRTLDPYFWPGIVCQPFSFGSGRVDWTGADQLRGRLDGLLREEHGSGLTVTRIARVYEGSFVFLIKPDRLRYWLQSIALRDADDVRADLRAQGF